MLKPENLATTIAAFELWRANKKSRSTRIPNQLRAQAVALLNNHRASDITSGLKISGSQFKQWRNALELTEQPQQFVELPMHNEPQDRSFNIELNFTSGEQMRLFGVIDSQLITTLIKAVKA